MPESKDAKVKISRRDHYDALKKRGIYKEHYETIEFPERIAYVYDWYNKISWCGFSTSNIKAFFWGVRVRPKPWEFELILALDRETKILEGQN